LGDLFSAKTGDPALAASLREAEVARTQLGATRPQKVSELILIVVAGIHRHTLILADDRADEVGRILPGRIVPRNNAL
jgi:hypothetical protein